MKELSTKLNYFTDSVIRRMTRIATANNAINLSQGYPDFDPPQELKQALENAARGDAHQYSVTWGARNFREALAKKQSRFMRIGLDPDTQIVVTCGSTEAMMAAMMTVCNKGDKVIVFSPFYENYAADAILSGAEPIYVPLHPPHFNFDAAELEAAFKLNPKALILCNPANPTGKVFTESELKLIAEFSEKYDTYVITDEVYEHIVYKPYIHTYFASLPGMAQRTISCSSLSKTYSITGWRLGYIISTPQIIEGARKIHDFLTVGAAAPLQEAAVTALNFGDGYYTELAELYTEKRDLFLNGLRNIGLSFSTPQGAYYVMVDVTQFGVRDDNHFAEWMAREIGVAAVPGSSFFKENIHNFVRFHFAKKKETLVDALDRLSFLPERAAKYRP